MYEVVEDPNCVLLARRYGDDDLQLVAAILGDITQERRELAHEMVSVLNDDLARRPKVVTEHVLSEDCPCEPEVQVVDKVDPVEAYNDRVDEGLPDEPRLDGEPWAPASQTPDANQRS